MMKQLGSDVKGEGSNGIMSTSKTSSVSDRTENEDNIDGGDSSDHQQDIPHPWPYFREMSEVVGAQNAL